MVFPFIIFIAAMQKYSVPVDELDQSNFFSLFLFFWTGFDLNLPVDEYGAVDFDYLQNHAGTYYKCLLAQSC
jgi:hypothetical protein